MAEPRRAATGVSTAGDARYVLHNGEQVRRRAPADRSPVTDARPAAVVAPATPPVARKQWDRSYAWLLVAVDVAAIASAVLITIAVGMVSLRRSFTPAWEVSVSRAVTDLALVFGWPAVLGVSRAYERRILGIGADEYHRVVLAAVRTMSTVALLVFFVHLPIRADYVLTVVAVGMILSLLGRRLARKHLHNRRAAGHDTRRVLAVGSAAAVTSLVDGLRTITYSGLRVVGAVMPGGTASGATTLVADVPVLGHPADLAEIIERADIDAIAIADSSTLDGPAVRRLAWSLEGREIDLLVVPTITDVVGPRVVIRPVGPIPLLYVDEPELTGPNRLAKGLFDRLSAALALLVLSPALLVLLAVVRLSSKGPALYRQERVGLDGRRFEIVKLRTMVVDADQRRADLCEELGHPMLLKAPDDPRITRVGRILRRWSIDELPQLWNVVKGDMSIVGPRPGLPEEVARYERHVHRRLLVKPGITGLWQVSGRSSLSWDDAVRLDLHYVDNWTIALDVQIVARTVAAVLRRQGAY